MTRHQYGISALVSQTSFRGETVSGTAKSQLFSQANSIVTRSQLPLVVREGTEYLFLKENAEGTKEKVSPSADINFVRVLCGRLCKQFFHRKSVDLKMNFNGKGLTQGYSPYGGS